MAQGGTTDGFTQGSWQGATQEPGFVQAKEDFRVHLDAMGQPHVYDEPEFTVTMTVAPPATISGSDAVALSDPSSAPAASPASLPDAVPTPFPLYGLGRVGYALPGWDRTAYGAFRTPTGGQALYTVVMPDPGQTLTDRLSQRTTDIRNEGDGATGIESSVIEGSAGTGAIGRVVRTIPTDPPSFIADYLFSTCPDGSATEVTFGEPVATADVASDTATWDGIAALVQPCHADYRMVPAGATLTGAPAALHAQLRSWARRVIVQQAALRQLIRSGPGTLRDRLARVRTIRANIARIDRDAQARIHGVFPEPFALPPILVTQATSGADVSAALGQLDQARSDRDIQTIAATVDETASTWLGGLQEAHRALGLGDTGGDLGPP